MSCAAVSRVLSLRYKQCRMEAEGKGLPGQRVSVLRAEMGLVCSRDQSLVVVVGKSLPLALCLPKNVKLLC